MEVLGLSYRHKVSHAPIPGFTPIYLTPSIDIRAPANRSLGPAVYLAHGKHGDQTPPLDFLVLSMEAGRSHPAEGLRLHGLSPSYSPCFDRIGSS